MHKQSRYKLLSTFRSSLCATLCRTNLQLAGIDGATENAGQDNDGRSKVQAAIDIAGLGIDGPCKLRRVCHFQSYEDMKKCTSTAVVIEIMQIRLIVN